jgi:hypothetical protein
MENAICSYTDNAAPRNENIATLGRTQVAQMRTLFAEFRSEY